MSTIAKIEEVLGKINDAEYVAITKTEDGGFKGHVVTLDPANLKAIDIETWEAGGSDTPVMKTPVWGEGVWHVKGTSGIYNGIERILKYDATGELNIFGESNLYYAKDDYWMIHPTGEMLAFSGDAYVDKQGKVDTTTSSKQTLTMTSYFEEIGTFTVEVWWTES